MDTSALREKLDALRRERAAEIARGPVSKVTPPSTDKAASPGLGGGGTEVQWRARGDAEIESSRRAVEMSDQPRRGSGPPKSNEGRREDRRQHHQQHAELPRQAGAKRLRDDAANATALGGDVVPAAASDTGSGEPEVHKRPVVVLDGATEQRSRRMLGALMGHLAKAKARIESVPDQARLTRQQELQEAALAKNAESRAAELEAAESAARALKEAHVVHLETLAAEERKTLSALVLAIADQHAAAIDAAASSGMFIVTEALPPLFWRPATLSHHTETSIAAGVARRQQAALERRALHARLQADADAAADSEALEARLKREARRAVIEAREKSIAASGARRRADPASRLPIRSARNREISSAVQAEVSGRDPTEDGNIVKDGEDGVNDTTHDAALEEAKPVMDEIAEVDVTGIEHQHVAGDDAEVPVDYS